MPWSQPGGGRGNGDGGDGSPSPWGRGPAAAPEGVDDVLRRGRDRLRGLLSGGGPPGGRGGGPGRGGGVSRGFGGGGVALLALLALAVWSLTGLYFVQADQQGVVLRFGRWVRTEPPGLHFHAPFPIETVLLPQVTKVNRTQIGLGVGDSRRAQAASGDPVTGDTMMLTGDENIIDIDFVVLWQIKDPGLYLFKIRDPEDMVGKAAQSAMREVIGKTEIQPALTEARQQIEAETLTQLQAMLDEYQSGIEVVQVQLQKVDPPAAVVDAFNDVQRARADKEKLRNEAEAFRNSIIPQARGEAEKLKQEALAYKEQTVALAEGDAKRFLSVYDAYARDPIVTARRMYLETMEQVLKGVHKVIIDKDAGGRGVLPYLPLDGLRPPPDPANDGKGGRAP